LSFFVSLILKGIFQSNMHILILDRHGSHVIQKAIKQAQTLELNIVILPSHTSIENTMWGKVVASPESRPW
jgi:hypothetical protein